MKKVGLLLLAVAGFACKERSGTQVAATPAPASGPLEQGRRLLEQGQLDAALAKLADAPVDPDSLYWQGVAWAKKAESAPIPTPPPPPSPLPKGYVPAGAPEFKPEELTAIDLFEKAVGRRPDHPRAHLALAELLAPHGTRWYDADELARKKRPSRAGQASEPVPPPDSGPDYRAERVVHEYLLAAQATPGAKGPVEALIRFCERVGRLEDADAAFRELIKRDKDNPAPLVSYGDFLVNERKDPLAAVEQYRQALIWRPADEATKAKLADVFIAFGIESFQKQQYAAAESRFKEAEKYVTDRNSPQGLKVYDHLRKLAAIRQPSVK